jgi:hypothetical protein
MLASFVIPCHTARIDNLLHTIKFLIRDHRSVVEWSDLSIEFQDNYEALPIEQINELETLREEFHRSSITSHNIKQMNLPYLVNSGVEGAETDRIFVLESDRILEANYFKWALKELREGVQITCKNMRKLTKPATEEEILNFKYEFKSESRSETNEIGMRNMWSGNTAILKSDFFRTGQMDERYIGYGWADSDMTNRTKVAGIQSIFRHEMELHLWHPSATYGSGDQKQQFIDNGLRFCKKWEQPLPDWFRAEIAQHKKVVL